MTRELILEDFTESRYASKQSLSQPGGGWTDTWTVSGYIDPRGGLNIGSHVLTNCVLIIHHTYLLREAIKVEKKKNKWNS